MLLDSLGSLNVFVQAAEARSFTAAGRQLGISPSAVGKAIFRLEERLGVRLFYRSTRTITLTPEGALFLERCRRIFCEVEAAESELAQTRGVPHGRLRISLPLVGMLMMPTISAFMHAYPEIVVDLDFTDRLVDIIEEGFDVVVRSGELTDSRLMTRILGSFPFVIAGAPGYFERRGTPQTPGDLFSHACLHHRYETSGRLEQWRLAGMDAAIDPPITAVASALEPLIHMAEQGLGIAYLPEFAIRRQLAAGALMTVLSGYTDSPGTFRMLWPSSRYVSPKLRVFLDFMAANLFAPPPDVSAGGAGGG